MNVVRYNRYSFSWKTHVIDEFHSLSGVDVHNTVRYLSLLSSQYLHILTSDLTLTFFQKLFARKSALITAWSPFHYITEYPYDTTRQTDR